VSSDTGSRCDPVCVLGFGRSGTSLTMRLLNLLGVEVGPEEDLLPAADADNSRGYWEPRWMIELNDEILAELGTVWQRPFEVEPGWERRPELDDLRDRARGLLAEKFGAAPLWGWKDPRVMVTLPFWQELVPDARYVFCLRNPADVISSFQRRPEPDLPVEAWGDLWTEFNTRALEGTRGRPRQFVFYEDFFRDGREQIALLASFLHLDTPEREDPAWTRLLEEVEPDLRHHSTSPVELAGAWGIPATTRALFLALRAAESARRAELATGNRDSRSADAIERVAPALWSERQLLADARVACTDAERHAVELRGELEQLRAELAAAREEQTRAHAEHARVRDELAGAHEELASASARACEAQADLAALEERLARQQAVIDGLRSSLSWRITAPLRAGKRLAGVKQTRRARNANAARP
jgi:hypothetical protein